MIGMSSVLVTDSVALRHALSYLFSAVLRADFQTFVTSTPDSQTVERASASDLVVVQLTETGDRRIPFIRELKRGEEPPVVIALHPSGSSLGAEALLAGADDVMIWPGRLHELALRSFLRLGLSLQDPALVGGGKSWELGAFMADKAGLSAAEAQILRILIDHFGDIVSRDDLSFALDERPWRYGDRKFDVHIAKIRKKLADTFGPDIAVETVRSEGYQFSTASNDIFDQAV